MVANQQITNPTFEFDDKNRSRLQTLMPRHYKVVEMYITGKYTHEQIAEACNMTRVNVSRIIKMPSAQDMIVRRRSLIEQQQDTLFVIDQQNAIDEAKKMLDESAEMAAGTLIENLLSGDEKLRNKSANDILDRVGIAKVTENRNKNQSAVIMIDAETASRIQKTIDLEKE